MTTFGIDLAVLETMSKQYRVIGIFAGFILLLAACGQRRVPNVTGDGASPLDAAVVHRDGGEIPLVQDAVTDGSGACDWTCAMRPGGRLFCTATHYTLPHFGGDWICNLTEDGWSCRGRVIRISPAPPGPAGACDAYWTFAEVIRTVGKPSGTAPDPGYYDIVRYTRPVLPGRDYPTRLDGWEVLGSESVIACVRGTIFGGTRCEMKTLAHPAEDPPHAECVPGTRRWCDGLQYSGWGQARCGSDGKWPTKILNGKHVLDCRELSEEARPLTACACYHFYFNPACCERVDCVVPYDHPEGQICAKSEGKLCDRCNPQKSECSDPGALCIITNTSETFCGQACSDNSACPGGYACMEIGKKNVKQCIPKDFSCYY